MWPAAPLDGWRGDAREVANRLLAGQVWSDAWYKRVASRTVGLACAAPAGPPRSAEEFLRRLSAKGLLEAYQDVDPEVLAEIEDLTRERGFAGVRLRYADYFDALAGRFDGDWSYGDGEVMVLRLPTLAEPEDAAGAFGFLLGTWPPTPFSARPGWGTTCTSSSTSSRQCRAGPGRLSTWPSGYATSGSW